MVSRCRGHSERLWGLGGRRGRNGRENLLRSPEKSRPHRSTSTQGGRQFVAKFRVDFAMTQGPCSSSVRVVHSRGKLDVSHESLAGDWIALYVSVWQIAPQTQRSRDEPTLGSSRALTERCHVFQGAHVTMSGLGTFTSRPCHVGLRSGQPHSRALGFPWGKHPRAGTQSSPA